MKTITIANENQNAVFTPRSVIIDGAEFDYPSIRMIHHSADDHTYSLADDRRQASITYSDKEEDVLNALFTRISQVAKLTVIETSEKKDAVSAPAEAVVPAEVNGILQRPVILVIEAAVALALLAAGIYLLFFSF